MFGSAGSGRGQAEEVVPCYAVLYLTLTIVDQMPASWSQQTKKIYKVILNSDDMFILRFTLTVLLKFVSSSGFVIFLLNIPLDF